MKKTNKTWFTLVELIVVITILAILWTIAFISLQWYSKQARDSKRISDISNIKTSLELFALQTWKYPSPDNSEIITYSWETVWTQWTVWDIVSTNLSRNLQKKPLDPLFDLEYVYSVTNSLREYELLSIYEWDISSNNLLSNTYAVNQYNPKIDWNYNQIFVKTQKYIVPIPSLITSLTWSFDLKDNIDNIKSQIITNWNNFPNLWISNTTHTTWELTGLKLSATWTITKDSTTAQKESVITTIIETYENSILASEPIYAIILNTSDPETLAEQLVLNKPSASSWWDDTPSAPTELITQTECEDDAWWIWVDTSNDVYIWTTQGDWFCISPRFWDWQTNWTDLNDWAWWISWNWWWNYSSDYYNWWNASNIDDASNSNPEYWQTRKLDSEVTYDCKALWDATEDYDTTDNIVWRMKWLATTWNTYANARSIDWITWLVPHTVWTYPHAIPALYIADCIDWEKDLWTWITMSYTHITDTEINTSTTDISTTDNVITYAEYNVDVSSPDVNSAALSDTTYQNRQKYLTAWTQQTGSHLPSAFSYISTWYASASDSDWDNLTLNDRWEYQVACETNLLTDANDDTDNERIWLSAIGSTTGTHWGRTARIVGYNGCGDQNNHYTGNRHGHFSARFVVRP